MRSIPRLSLSILALGGAINAQAADFTHTLTPYLWGASLSGKAAAGSVATDVDASFGDIMKNLKMGAMLSYRGDSDRLVILGDLVYMRLGADKTVTAGPIQIDTSVGVKQLALEGDAGLRLSERVVAFAGLRYQEIDANLDIIRTGTGAGPGQSAGTLENWVDPVIGIVTDMPLNERWSLGLRADIGGFGIGSDFTWQAIATVRWKAKENLHIVGGYRYLDVDYQKGSGASLFKYDMATSGLGLGVAFTL